MNYKKRLYILILTIVSYFIFNHIYENSTKTDQLSQIYILNKDIVRGELITKDAVKQIEILNSDNNLNRNIYISDEQIGKVVSNNSYNLGQALLKDMVILKNEFINIEDDNELISISINKSDDNVSNQIKKGNIVNIYYTGKSSQVIDLVNKSNFESVVSDLESDGYSTIKIINNTEIINVFDKNGNEIKDNGRGSMNNINEDMEIIDTIMIKTTKEIVMLINNLKKYGTFSVSIKR